MVLTTVLGYIGALHLPGWLGIPRIWGAAGLTASAGLAGWVEMLSLRRTLNSRIGRTGLATDYMARIWGAAVAAAAVAWVIKLAAAGVEPVVKAILVLMPYGLIYVGATWAFKIPEAAHVLGRVVQRVQRAVSRLPPPTL